jgi:hypothetical protein
MSFLFGKKSKHSQQNNALPPATRDITSSGGQPSPLASPPEKARPPLQQQSSQPQLQSTSPPSANTSYNSLSNVNAAPQDLKPPQPLRERSDSNGPVRSNQRALDNLHLNTDLPSQNGRIAANQQQESPYPWSSRRLNFTTGGNPFPRYGAAINATASKDGTIYLMGGLVGGATVKGDLWLTEMGNGSMSCYPISTTGDGPGPRVGHASLLVGNAFIVFGGDTKLADNDDLDDTLYLLNTCKRLAAFPLASTDTCSNQALVSCTATGPPPNRSLWTYIEYPGLQDLHFRWPGRRLLLQRSRHLRPQLAAVLG